MGLRLQCGLSGLLSGGCVVNPGTEEAFARCAVERIQAMIQSSGRSQGEVASSFTASSENSLSSSLGISPDSLYPETFVVDPRRNQEEDLRSSEELLAQVEQIAKL